MEIVKSTGERVPFDPKKIQATIRRAGGSEQLSERVLQRVIPKVRNGMATKRLLAIVRKELRRENRLLAQRYNLRDGLMRLGPAGFKFEKYVASILNAYGWQAMVPEREYVGRCVSHEVDIVANRNGTCVMIEAKFRNRFADTVTLRDTMAAWARFSDLEDGHRDSRSCPHIDESWIVTNGEFTDRAQKFGQCKGLKMVGWSGDESLAQMVDHAALYPVTVIDGLRQWELDRLAHSDLMLCREVAEEDPKKLSGRLRLSRARTKQIWEQCRAITDGT
ncbi:MAG: ATP cone domain-containing protein [bacterium]